MNPVILPGVTRGSHPTSRRSSRQTPPLPAILGDLISSGLGVQGMLRVTSPACTEVETHVMDWMAELLALPERFKSTSSGGGVIEDSASSATLCALLGSARAGDGACCQRAWTGWAAGGVHLQPGALIG